MSDAAPEAVLWDLLRGALATKALGDRRRPRRRRRARATGRGRSRSSRARSAPTRTRCTGSSARSRATASSRRTSRASSRNTEASELLRRTPAGSEFAHLFGGVLLRGDRRRSMRTAGRDVRAALRRPTSGPGSPSIPTSARRSTARWRTARTARPSGSPALEWRDDETRRRRRRRQRRRCSLELLAAAARAARDRLRPAGDGARRGGARRPASSSSQAASSSACPTGDAYVLSAILHDWDDEGAAAILRTIRAAAPGRRAAARSSSRSIQPGNEPRRREVARPADARARRRPRARRGAVARAPRAARASSSSAIEDGLIEARCR